MFLVEVVGTLLGAGRLTDDEITDVIEIVVDELDAISTEPSVGTTRRGDDVEITVSVAADGHEELDALSTGVAAVKAAFHAAGIGTSTVGAPSDLRTQVSPLELV